MKKTTTEEFIEKAKAVHGDKYDYSKVVYEHSKKPVIMLCPIHGEHHYRPIKTRGGHSKYLKIKSNDYIKDNFSKERGIRLLIIPYWDFDNIEEILKKELNS